MLFVVINIVRGLTHLANASFIVVGYKNNNTDLTIEHKCAM